MTTRPTPLSVHLLNADPRSPPAPQFKWKTGHTLACAFSLSLWVSLIWLALAN